MVHYHDDDTVEPISPEDQNNNLEAWLQYFWQLTIALEKMPRNELLTYETDTRNQYPHYNKFPGQQVRISKCKATRQLFFNKGDVAMVLDRNDMMSVQAILLGHQI